MKYRTLFVVFEKQQNIKLSSATNYRWHFMGYDICAYFTLCMLRNVAFFLLSTVFFSKLIFSKNYFKNTIRVSNSYRLDPGWAQHLVIIFANHLDHQNF